MLLLVYSVPGGGGVFIGVAGTFVIEFIFFASVNFLRLDGRKGERAADLGKQGVFWRESGGFRFQDSVCE